MARFKPQVKVSVTWADGTTESFKLPERLAGRLGPVIAAHYPYGSVTIGRGDMVARTDDDLPPRQRLSAFACVLAGFFGRSQTQGGCEICGHLLPDRS